MADKNEMELPLRVFLYTVDQLALMLAMEEQTVLRFHLFFDGRSVGKVPPGRMLARNIAPEGETPDWRVAEPEFKRWLKFKRFRVYDPSTVKF